MNDDAPHHILTRRTVLAALLAAGLTAPLRAMTQSVLLTEDGRDMRVSRWPAADRKLGTILFSHGASSAPEKYQRLIEPWAAAGFEVVAPLHVDSTDHPDHARYGMLDSWRARLQDMRALAGEVGGSSYVAAGHSYGGLVALTLGGVKAVLPADLQPPLRDPRVSAVLAFSPPGVTTPGLVTAEGFRSLAVPALIETGDRDIPFGSTDGQWQVHLAAYQEAPPGDKYAVILEGVDHYFGGLICKPGAPGPPQSDQLDQAVRLSIAFLNAYGAKDGRALRQLEQSLQNDGAVRLDRK
jgi:predicted alpha/beta-hydrolase family hydrolase